MIKPITNREYDEAEIMLQQVVNAHLPILQARLNTLHPLEALAILGNLTTETLEAIAPQDRMQACLALTDTIVEAVRSALRGVEALAAPQTPGKNRRRVDPVQGPGKGVL
jgi:hypothetical protein